MSKNNIILIGMPGSGKSTLGVVLAKKIGYSFIDSDIVIQDTYKKTLEQLIEENGDTGFIKIENDVNCLISPEHTIIATGGSAVYGDEAMEHFKQIGTVIYLIVPQKEIFFYSFIIIAIISHFYISFVSFLYISSTIILISRPS